MGRLGGPLGTVRATGPRTAGERALEGAGARGAHLPPPGNERQRFLKSNRFGNSDNIVSVEVEFFFF